MNLSLRNSAKYAGSTGDTDWWEWTAFVESPDPSDLDAVEFVEYRLHPSFKTPIRRVRKKSGGFPLKAKGWGTFDLVARIVFKDKSRRPVLLEHNLEFEDSE